MAGKRRFVGPGGGVFVPNVDDETIEQMVESGEWVPVEESTPSAPKPARKATKKTAK